MTKTRTGRRNRYSVNAKGHLRHPLFRDFEIGPLLDILNTGISNDGQFGD